MASGQQKVEYMRWLIPNVFPQGEYYVTYRPCYCGNEMVLVPIPMYPAPSPWPAYYYPPSSCLTKSSCECYQCKPVTKITTCEEDNIVKSDRVLPVYPTYPEVQPKFYRKKRSTKHRRRIIIEDSDDCEANNNSGSGSDVDR